MGTESFLCTDCGITFTAKKNLTRHIVLVHAKTQVTCEKCGKHFTREDNLKRHLVRCNPKNSDTLTCEKCQKKFSSKSNLNKQVKKQKKTRKKQLKLWNHLEDFSQNISTET